MRGAWPDRTRRALAGAAACAALVLALSGCGSSARTTSTASSAVPADLLAQARPIGRGTRFHPPANGPVVGSCTPKLGARVGSRVELFAENRVVLIAAGAGTRPPVRYSDGPVQRPLLRRPRDAGADPGRCWCNAAPLTLADLFRWWSRHRCPPSTAWPRSRRARARACACSSTAGREPARPARSAEPARGDRARGRAARAAARFLHIPARDLSRALFLAGEDVRTAPARRADRRLAPLALMPLAAFAVHQLRYSLAFGGHAACSSTARATCTCSRWHRGSRSQSRSPSGRSCRRWDVRSADSARCRGTRSRLRRCG